MKTKYWILGGRLKVIPLPGVLCNGIKCPILSDSLRRLFDLFWREWAQQTSACVFACYEGAPPRSLRWMGRERTTLCERLCPNWGDQNGSSWTERDVGVRDSLPAVDEWMCRAESEFTFVSIKALFPFLFVCGLFVGLSDVANCL